MLDAAVAARLEQGGDSHRHLELSPKRCDSRCNCGMAHVIVGARVAASALSAHSAAAPSQGRHSSPQARIFFRQQMAGAPRPCLQPWTQIQQTQKMTPTDLTPLPCSTRAFTYARVWTPELTGPVRTTSCRALHPAEQARGRPRGEPRLIAGGSMRRPPRRDLRALGAKFAFCAPRGRRVRTSLGRDDVGPCPRYPGASAGRVADSGAAREVARDDRKTRRFHCPH